MIELFKKNLLVILFCIPLFFINIKDWTDWGDDFAQYLSQAENIIKGQDYPLNGYIYNDDFSLYAPKTYPQGFPLIILPIIAWKGIDIQPLVVYMTLILVIFGILIYNFLRRYYSKWVSLSLVIIVLYNPWTLSFKADIVSDIPFSVFFLLSLMMFLSHSNRSIWKLIILSFIVATTIFIRSIGIVLPFAFIIYAVIEFCKNLKRKDKPVSGEIKFSISVAMLSLILFALMNKIIFPLPGNSVFLYQTLIDFQHLQQTIQTNLTYYTTVTRAFFEPWNDKWQFVSIISGSLIFTFIILGMIRKMVLNFDFIDILFIIYISILIVYPYSNAGFRFLFPLVPILIIYLVKGILSIDIPLKIPRNTLTILLTIFVLFSYKKGISEIMRNEKIISEGPQVPGNKEAIQFIIARTEPDARISFKRPRALALYSHRSSMTHRDDATGKELLNNLEENKINYVLICYEDFNKNIVDLINDNPDIFEKVFENAKNKLYKIKKY
jgi:hypothetical protein